jgi:putative chitinase
MHISEQVLKTVCPYGKMEIIKGVVESFNELASQFDVTTELRICHFFAQASVETDWFKTLEEYASGRDYEGRKDLGNTQSGDGQKYKGRGIFQTTGRANYTAAGKEMNLDLVNHPELLLNPKNAVLSALIYWRSRNMNDIADRDDIGGATRAVNGGYNGFNERQRALLILKSALGEKIVGCGSTIDDVKNVQTMLKLLGYKVGIIDGLYGPATDAAIKMFQSDNGLPRTGVANTATLDLLEKKTNEKKTQ